MESVESLKLELIQTKAELEQLRQDYNRLSYRLVTQWIGLSKKMPFLGHSASIFLRSYWSIQNQIKRLSRTASNKSSLARNLVRLRARRLAKPMQVIAIEVTEPREDLGKIGSLLQRQNPQSTVIWLCQKRLVPLIESNELDGIILIEGTQDSLWFQRLGAVDILVNPDRAKFVM